MATTTNPNAIGADKRLVELQGEEYQFIQNEQDLEALDEYIPKKELEKLMVFSGDKVTGAVVKHGDGEYLEIWVTTTSGYYFTGTIYTRVA